jgi:hypothetical protein
MATWEFWSFTDSPEILVLCVASQRLAQRLASMLNFRSLLGMALQWKT